MEQAITLTEAQERAGIKKLFRVAEEWEHVPVNVTRRVKQLPSNAKDVTPYTCRHTLGAWLAQFGVPMRSLQLIPGHRYIVTT